MTDMMKYTLRYDKSWNLVSAEATGEAPSKSATLLTKVNGFELHVSASSFVEAVRMGSDLTGAKPEEHGEKGQDLPEVKIKSFEQQFAEFRLWLDQLLNRSYTLHNDEKVAVEMSAMRFLADALEILRERLPWGEDGEW